MSAGLGPASRSYAAAVRASAEPVARGFERALKEPERAQKERLQRVLDRVAGSRQAGRIAGFSRIRTAHEFQDAVPLCIYDDLVTDVRDLGRGHPAIFTRDPVLRFEPSGGSSGPSKHVPHTAALLREFQAALLPWLFDLARRRPRTFRGPAYWSISPLGQQRGVTPGGIPIGGANDSAYFPVGVRRLLARRFAVPDAVSHVSEIEICRYVTLRYLLERGDLAFVSVWNPSFLTLLVEAADRHGERLADDLATGACRPPGLGSHRAPIPSDLPMRANPMRARTLRRLLGSDGRLPAAQAWPHLAMISAWTDAQARRTLPALRERFPGVEIHGKGLLATEGVVSIPWLAAPAPVLAVRSHFLEFIDATAPLSRPLLAHELESGRTYEVVLSTSAGFLRYRLGDQVRVEGYCERTPCVRFVGRADGVADLVGEKLGSGRVSAVFTRVFGDAGQSGAPRFAMLAPEWGAPPAYYLYLECDREDQVLDEWARQVEAALLEGFPYRYARELGQLGEVRAIRVRGAQRGYEAGCVAQGQRAGDIKPVDLALRPGWRRWLGAGVGEPGEPGQGAGR